MASVHLLLLHFLTAQASNKWARTSSDINRSDRAFFRLRIIQIIFFSLVAVAMALALPQTTWRSPRRSFLGFSSPFSSSPSSSPPSSSAACANNLPTEPRPRFRWWFQSKRGDPEVGIDGLTSDLEATVGGVGGVAFLLPRDGKVTFVHFAWLYYVAVCVLHNNIALTCPRTHSLANI